MLGNGCPWKGMCNAKNGYNKKNYCNTISDWQKCPHRPVNSGNKQIEQKYNYRKSNHSSINIFWGIVIVWVILWFITRFM